MKPGNQHFKCMVLNPVGIICLADERRVLYLCLKASPSSGRSFFKYYP